MDTPQSNLDLSNVECAKRRAFLLAYEHCGVISVAARKVGVHRTCHYDWLKTDEGYAKAWKEADDEAVERMEAELLRRAVLGIEEDVRYQGEVVGKVRKFSDILLIFLLKAKRPAVYRDNFVALPSGDVSVLFEQTRILMRQVMSDPDTMRAAGELAKRMSEQKALGHGDEQPADDR